MNILNFENIFISKRIQNFHDNQILYYKSIKFLDFINFHKDIWYSKMCCYKKFDYNLISYLIWIKMDFDYFREKIR